MTRLLVIAVAIAAAAIPALAGPAIAAEAFQHIRIGDIDGFGFRETHARARKIRRDAEIFFLRRPVYLS